MSTPQRTVVVAVEGRVDAANAPALLERLRAAAADPPGCIIADLGQATYLSSSGLRALLLVHREQLALGCDLVLTNVPPKIMRILAMAGFDQVLHIRSCPDP